MTINVQVPAAINYNVEVAPVMTIIAVEVRTAAEGSSGAGSYAELSDRVTVNLPSVNTALASALAGKQPLAAALTATTASFTTAKDALLATQQTALDLKAPLASPAFTGTVTIPAGASISGYVQTADLSSTTTRNAVLPTASGGGQAVVWNGSAWAASTISASSIGPGAITGCSIAASQLTGNIPVALIASALTAPGAIGGTTAAAGSFTTLSASGAITAPNIKAASGSFKIDTNASGASGAGSFRFGGTAINQLESWGGTAGGAFYVYTEGNLRMLIGGSSGLSIMQNTYADNAGLTLGLASKRWGTLFGTTIDATGLATLSGGMQLGTKTVGTLPPASTNLYLEFVVTDALAPAVGSSVATGTGASAKCKVISNGTNWLVSTIL